MQPGAVGPATAGGQGCEASLTEATQPLGPEASCPASVERGIEQQRPNPVAGGHGYSALAGAGGAVMPPLRGRAAASVLAPPAPSLATSSQRDTLTARPSRLLSSEAATDDKDEYLMRLLRKGMPAQHPPAPASLRAPLEQQGALPQALSQLPQQVAPQQAAAPPATSTAVPAAAVAAEVSGFRAPGPVRRGSGGGSSLADAAAALAAAAGSGPGPPAAAAAAALSPARLLTHAASTSLPSPLGEAAATTGNGATVPSLATTLPTPATTTDQAVPSCKAVTAGAAAATAAPPANPAATGTLQVGSGPTGGSGAGSGNAMFATAATLPAAQLPGGDGLSDSFAVTRQRLGDEMTYNVRNSMIRQQVMFLEQLYDLHRAIAIQKLLMQNCPEVQQVMGEAMRLMSSVGSQHGSGSGRGSKRGQRTTPNGGATVPGSGSGDPSSFRPDSQFAAVPQLPGEAQTAGGSGEDEDGGSGDGNGSGSGQNGSGGGSTSPQQLGRAPPRPAPPPYMYLAHTAVATPSGASAAPNAAWHWGAQAALGHGHGQQQEQQQAVPPAPQGPPQMAPWVGQDAGLAAVGINTHPPPHTAANTAAPAAGGSQGAAEQAAARGTATNTTAAPSQQLAAPPMPAMPPSAFAGAAAATGLMTMPGALPPGNDPLSWWYQNYYGAAAAAASFQQAQAQAQQQLGGMTLATAQAAAAAAAALMPPPPVPHGATGAGGLATQGPHMSGAGTATATAVKWWQDPRLTFGPAADPDLIARRTAGATAMLGSGREGGEVQSAPAGKRGGPAGAGGAPLQRRASLYSEGRMHLKRKAAAVAVDADEASSGTTGHALASHEVEAGAVHTAGSPRGTLKRQESLRARSARMAPAGHRQQGGDAAGAAAGGALDEKAAALLLAIGGKK